jgi:hypothetical protein
MHVFDEAPHLGMDCAVWAFNREIAEVFRCTKASGENEGVQIGNVGRCQILYFTSGDAGRFLQDVAGSAVGAPWV